MRAIIAGTSLFRSALFKNWDEVPVETPYGKVIRAEGSQHLFLQRHGKKPLPPHRINHHANIWALKSLGVEGVIAINSVGSLKVELSSPVLSSFPMISSPSVTSPPSSTMKMRFTIPVMDRGVRQENSQGMHEAWRWRRYSGGIYMQTTGPRFETKAEVNILKKEGDVVGMTMASEATLCMEYAIPYVSLCSIDNYCNGIIKTPLTIEEVEEQISEERQEP